MPVASADIKDFVSGCWFAHGSTALLRREAFDRVGPTDPALGRMEDYDWFIRFALLGGRLEIWPHFAALIEVRRKAGMHSAEPSIAHLRAKYANPAAGLPPDVINQIEACFDFELASIRSADGRWLTTLFYLCRSFWRVPRTTLHLRRLWTRTAVDLPGGMWASAPAHADGGTTESDLLGKPAALLERSPSPRLRGEGRDEGALPRV